MATEARGATVPARRECEKGSLCITGPHGRAALFKSKNMLRGGGIGIVTFRGGGGGGSGGAGQCKGH